jgi:hypothetical protein
MKDMRDGARKASRRRFALARESPTAEIAKGFGLTPKPFFVFRASL